MVDFSFHSLPQYGAISVPFTGSRAPIVGEKPASGLFGTSSFDAFFGTTPAVIENSVAALGPRLARQALGEHNRAIWESWKRHEEGLGDAPDFDVEAPFRFRSHALLIGSVAGPYDSWSPGRYAAVSSISFTRPGAMGKMGPAARCHLDVDSDANAKRARLRFVENGLETSMEIGRDFVRTAGFVIHTDESGLFDFIRASLAHYEGVDSDALDPGATLLLAANLLHHQQFVMKEGEARPYAWNAVARNESRGADFEAALRAGTAFTDGCLERVFVPSGDRSESVVEIRRLLSGGIEIFIRRPGEHSDLMPLRGNVLALAACALMPGRLPRGIDLIGSLPRAA